MDKKLYESVKAIKTKIATGETTTFAERNYMKIVMKNEEKRKKEKLKYLS